MKTKAKKQFAAAVAAALETKQLQTLPEHLNAVAKFSPIFEKLASRSVSLMFDVSKAVREVIDFLKVPATKEGHHKTMLVIKNCTTDSSVLVYSRQWAAVMLAEKKGAPLGEVSREQSENVWADVPATVELIESRAELLGCSTKAGEALGFKKRKTGEKKRPTTITPENVFDYLPAIFKSQAGIAQLRKLCNDNGYELTARMTVDGPLEQAAAGRGTLRKAA